MVTFEKNKLFELSCQLRPIKAFRLEDLLEVDMDEIRRYLCPENPDVKPKLPRRFLSNDAKLLWFYQFCQEQGLKGKVDAQFVRAESLRTGAYPENQNGMTNLVKEYWSATVYLNGEAVATANASGTFAVNDQFERDFASGMLRKSAIGSALSQAGFGVVSSFNLTENEISQLAAAMDPLNDPAPITPPRISAGSLPAAPAAPVATPQHVMQDSFFGAPAPAPAAPGAPTMYMAPPANAALEHVVQAQPAQQQVDPLIAAKQMMWPAGGRFKGKTLGTILSEGGASSIAFIANEYVARNEEGQRVKAAAKLILTSLQTGK